MEEMKNFINCGKTVKEEEISCEREDSLKRYILIQALSLGISLDDDQLTKFVTYLKMIQEYQKKINITSTKVSSDIIDKHFLESLSCMEMVNRMIGEYGNKNRKDLIDVGSGAGFPGIPLKIILSRERMTLLEVRKNKKLFLDSVVDGLQLPHTVVIKDRAENLGMMKEYRENYHIVLSRAVAPLGILCEYCLPLCKMQGAMIAFKGSSYEAELTMYFKVMERLGGTLECIHQYRIPHSEHIRSILLVRKTRSTPENFPRKEGIPHKRPLYF